MPDSYSTFFFFCRQTRPPYLRTSWKLCRGTPREPWSGFRLISYGIRSLQVHTKQGFLQVFTVSPCYHDSAILSPITLNEASVSQRVLKIMSGHPSGALEWFPAISVWDSFVTSWYEARFPPSLHSFSLLPRFRHFVTDNPDQATHRQLRASSLSSHLDLGLNRTLISLWALHCVPLGFASKNSALILKNHVNYIKIYLTPYIPEFSWRDCGRTRNTTVSWFESRSDG